VLREVHGGDGLLGSGRTLDRYQGIPKGGRRRLGKTLKAARVLRMSRIDMARRGDAGEREA